MLKWKSLRQNKKIQKNLGLIFQPLFYILKNFYKKPKTLKSVYKKHSEGLIIGSACEQGELYKAVLTGKSEEEIERIILDKAETYPLRTGGEVGRITRCETAVKDYTEHLKESVNCNFDGFEKQGSVYAEGELDGYGYTDRMGNMTDNFVDTALTIGDKLYTILRYLIKILNIWMAK